MKRRSFLLAEPTLAWLSQFDPKDQQDAVALLQEMTLVSRDAFSERLQALILQRMNDDTQPIGIYVEREIRKRKGVPHRLFQQAARKTKRAYGGGPAPVKPANAYDPTVGSEGIVAQLVGELCRQHPKILFSNPGPDLIRKYKIRRFFLVTDFIGSGDRAWTYLESAWRVRSVRSWWSRRVQGGLRFEVIAYAATQEGRAYVAGHNAQPQVHAVTSCPTIDACFSQGQRSRIRDLCIRYNPKKKDDAFGYKGGGVLVAFAHGMPNNAPTIFHKRSKSWQPLFPARITSSTRETFSAEELDPDSVRRRLVAMRQTRLAKARHVPNAKPHVQVTMLVLAALSHPPRDFETISRRTGLTFLDVEVALTKAKKQNWIDEQHRLTDQGQAELRNAKRTSSEESSLPTEPKSFYYPSSLREPSQLSR